MESPISHHAKLTLARICVVPMANYAPLVEMESPLDDYESFDRQVGEALAGMLDCPHPRTKAVSVLIFQASTRGSRAPRGCCPRRDREEGEAPHRTSYSVSS